MEEIYKKIIEQHNLNKISLIGKGGYGTVYLVKKDNNLFAMKIIGLNKKAKNKDLLKQSIHAIQEELSWSKNMNSLYCVNTLSIFKDEVKDYIIFSMVMEIAKYNDLKYFIFNYYENNSILCLNNKIKKKLNILTVKYFVYQILQSLLFLKEHLLVHCDIKLENYLLCNHFILKLSDFSCMKLLKVNQDLKLKSSTWNIKGKEYFTNNKIVDFSNAFKIDVYCAGLMIYKLRYNKYIIEKDLKDFFNNKNIEKKKKCDKLEKEINKAINVIENDNDMNKDFKDFFISMIHNDINKRSNIENLLNNKWINEHEIINKIQKINETEEIKLFLEFEKYKKIKRKRFKFIFKKTSKFI